MNRHAATLIAAVAAATLMFSSAAAHADSRNERSKHHDRHDDNKHGRDRDRDHGHDDHRWGHSSHRKSCGHVGACPTRTHRICVHPGHYDNRYVPAVTKVCYDSCGRPYTVVIKPACWTKVWVPPTYETRHVSVCDSGHNHGHGHSHGHRSGLSFSWKF